MVGGVEKGGKEGGVVLHLVARQGEGVFEEGGDGGEGGVRVEGR